MPLTLREAQAVITGAHERAAKLDAQITVAVVDEGGHLQALGRMSGAAPLSAQIAETKAASIALFRRDERVTIGEVQVDRGGGYRHRTGDRAQRQGLVVGEVAEHPHGGGNDLLPQPLPLPARVGAAGAGSWTCRGGVVHRPVILAARTSAATTSNATVVHIRTVVHLT